jgi:hypothetical protein
MKFSKPFLGCKAGDVYPTQFLEGAECPSELLDAAMSVGAVGEVSETKPSQSNKARTVAPENK